MSLQNSRNFPLFVQERLGYLAHEADADPENAVYGLSLAFSVCARQVRGEIARELGALVELRLELINVVAEVNVHRSATHVSNVNVSAPGLNHIVLPQVTHELINKSVIEV